MRVGDGARGPAVVDRVAQPHRLSVAQVHRHRRTRTATRSATTRSAPPRSSSGCRPTRRSSSPRTSSASTGPPAPAVAASASDGSSCGRDGPMTARRSRRASRVVASTGGRRSSRRGPPARRWPRATPARRASTPILDVVPPLMGGGADLTGNTGTEMPAEVGVFSEGEPSRSPDPLRRARARHGRSHERHGAARWRVAGRWHLLHLQRLHAAVGAAGRALRGQGHLLVDPRLGRARRGRPDASADRTAHVVARHARPARDPARRRQRDGHGLPHRGERHRAHRAWC